MKNYLIKIKAELPYPVERKYREGASRMVVAVKRAIDKHRKEVNNRKVKELAIKVIVIQL